MFDTIDALTGERLTLDEYSEDFGNRFRSISNTDIWKLERQQEFHQPESKSWVAFTEGRREESLRLLEDNRTALREQFAKLTLAGSGVRRVRVVERPFTTYLLWELHSLRVRAQCGEDIRVVSADALAPYEHERQAPEVVTFGGSVLYRILYDAQGVIEGAVKFTDTGLTARCRGQIADLHKSAEPIEDFFLREVGGARTSRA